jgi:predicted RNA-binding protein with EMAP domain
MVGDKAFAAVIAVFVLFAGLLLFNYARLAGETAELSTQLEKLNSSVHIPISSDEAVRIATEDEEFLRFAQEHFANASLRVTRAVLEFNPEVEGYLWRVEIMERKCGCAGLGSINAMVVYVDPVSGEVLAREEHIGKTEAELARETCEKGCH